jgi:hypothetical protein
MHRGGACLLVILCICQGGCLSGNPAKPSTLLRRLHLPGSGLGPDGALLDIALVERPLGDAFLNDELWASTDIHVVGLEKKGLLEDNGFCVGQVIGMNPARLQDLIESKRYCVTCRRQILPSGTPTVVPLGPTLAKCDFRVIAPDGPHDVGLDQGQCTLTIVPSLTNDGRTRLKFTPQVLYGCVVPSFQVAPECNGFQYQCARPNKTYDSLSWEITLAPNQYVVIGTHFDENAPDDAPQSLGNQCFLVEKGHTFTQRLLVIRTTRGGNQASDDKIRSDEPGGAAASPQISPAAHCLQCPGY